MTYQRTTRRQRHLRYARARKERVHTGLGQLFRLLRWLGAARLARSLVRRPWHVDGRFERALYVYPKDRLARRAEQVEQLARMAMRKGPRTHTKHQARQ